MDKIKVILVPGNGGYKPTDNWFPYAERELKKANIEVINREFPDSILAREEYWIPFLKTLGADSHTILVGHSSGAIAAMRFAEKSPLLGSVLVGSYYTDLGMESEKQSGYFNRPWDWKSIQKNQKFIGIFASTDDPWIPIEEARHLQENLKGDYFEYTNRGHFMETEFPELISYILKKG